MHSVEFVVGLVAGLGTVVLLSYPVVTLYCRLFVYVHHPLGLHRDQRECWILRWYCLRLTEGPWREFCAVQTVERIKIKLEFFSLPNQGLMNIQWRL